MPQPRNPELQLNHVFELYVPTKCRCGKALSDDVRQEALKKATSKMVSWFRGGTHKGESSTSTE